MQVSGRCQRRNARVRAPIVQQPGPAPSPIAPQATPRQFWNITQQLIARYAKDRGQILAASGRRNFWRPISHRSAPTMPLGQRQMQMQTCGYLAFKLGNKSVSSDCVKHDRRHLVSETPEKNWPDLCLNVQADRHPGLRHNAPNDRAACVAFYEYCRPVV